MILLSNFLMGDVDIDVDDEAIDYL